MTAQPLEGKIALVAGADPELARFSGKALSTWQLSKIYGFRDIDGSQPDWGSYFESISR